MSENPILISNLNDFIFCPVSIYFHSLEKDADDFSAFRQENPQKCKFCIYESMCSYSIENGGE